MPAPLPDINPFDPPVQESGAGLRSDITPTGPNGGNVVFMPGSWSALVNKATGLGGNQDKTEEVEVTNPRMLTEGERNILYMGYGLIQRACNIYPDEAPKPIWTFEDKPDGDSRSEAVKVNEYLGEFKMEGFWETLYKCLIEARKDGSSYMLLGIDDGQEWDQAVDMERIQGVEWSKLLFHDELRLEAVGAEHYILAYKRRNVMGLTPTQNRSESDSKLRQQIDSLESNVRIHRSRVWEFAGERLPDSMRRYDPNAGHCSTIQLMFNGFSKAVQAMGYSNHAIANYVTFAYLIEGFSTLLNGQGHEQIMEKATALNLARSVAGVTIADAGHDLKMLSANYGGMADLIKLAFEYMVMESGITRFKLLGSANQEGLGSEGRGLQNRLEHATRLESWCNKHLAPFYQYILKLVIKAKNGPTGGQVPASYGLKFPQTLELTPAELAELVKQYIEAYNVAIANGTLTEVEAREALFSGEVFPLNPTPVLDQEYTTKLIAAVAKRDLEKALGKTPPPQLGEASDGPETTQGQDENPKDKSRSDDATRAIFFRYWQGFRVGVQYVPLMERHGVILTAGYGYLQKTRIPKTAPGGDGMAVDVYIGVHLDSPLIFRVAQKKPHGGLDEYKYMIGFKSMDEARAAYEHAKPGLLLEIVAVDPLELEGLRIDSKDDAVIEEDEWWDAIANDIGSKEVQSAALQGISDVA